MKLLKVNETKREELNRFFPEKNDEFLKEVILDSDSKYAKSNINYIQSYLMTDYNLVSDIFDDEYMFDDGETPVLAFREYLQMGLSFITTVVKGKIAFEVIPSNSLIEVTTHYVLVTDILEFDGEDEYLHLYPVERIAAEPILEADSVMELLPELTKQLISEGIVEVVEIED